MERTLILALLMIPAIAIAQQASPTEQAMSNRIVRELQAGIACEVNLLTVQAELAKANDKIKELEAKAKPEEAPK